MPTETARALTWHKRLARVYKQYRHATAIGK
jgi:hypothetical protein